jgi:hypothetical protein
MKKTGYDIDTGEEQIVHIPSRRDIMYVVVVPGLPTYDPPIFDHTCLTFYCDVCFTRDLKHDYPVGRLNSTANAKEHYQIFRTFFTNVECYVYPSYIFVFLPFNNTSFDLPSTYEKHIHQQQQRQQNYDNNNDDDEDVDDSEFVLDAHYARKEAEWDEQFVDETEKEDFFSPSSPPHLIHTVIRNTTKYSDGDYFFKSVEERKKIIQSNYERVLEKITPKKKSSNSNLNKQKFSTTAIHHHHHHHHHHHIHQEDEEEEEEEEKEEEMEGKEEDDDDDKEKEDY